MLLFDSENGRSILTLKKSPIRGKISTLKKKYLENGKSHAPKNLPVCSTHGYYKLVNLQGYSSLQEEDIFFQAQKIAT